MGLQAGRLVSLVLLETAANQRFIFATNKLRENVGASQLTWESCTRWVLEALGDGVRVDTAAAVRQVLAAQRPIEQGGPHEVVLAASGKALVLVSSPEAGEALVAQVTAQAQREGAGLDVRGVVSAPFAFGVGQLSSQVAAVHRDLAAVRGNLPAAEVRFPTLPILAPCASTGLPATRVESEGGTPVLRSAVALAKRAAAERATARMAHAAGEHRLPRDLARMEQQLDRAAWLGVLHVDGNGLGRLFLGLARHCGGGDRDYINTYRAASSELDAAMERAWQDALASVPADGSGFLPVVPLVLGGDDLTVLCAGDCAVGLAHDLLVAFERRASEQPTLAELAHRAVPGRRLTSCAGVAVVKAHYPFHAAYSLAEALLRSAKQVKLRQPDASALDYHVLYDSSATALDQLRDHLLVDGGRTSLVSRPYVVTGAPTDAWAAVRQWDLLAKRVAAMLAETADGSRALPNSQLHALREGLFHGAAEADARWRLMAHRYRGQGIRALAATNNPDSLFEHDGSHAVTGLLDALDLLEFWGVAR